MTHTIFNNIDRSWMRYRDRSRNANNKDGHNNNNNNDDDL